MASGAKEFDTAFAAARKKGDKTFTHKGKDYSTKTAEEDMQESYDADIGGPGFSIQRDNQQYRDYVAEKTPNSYLSRGANLRGAAVRKLREEGKMGDESNTVRNRERVARREKYDQEAREKTAQLRKKRPSEFKSGGTVRGDGICAKGKTKGRMV